MSKRIAAFDVETDPFAKGRTVAPFCWGFWDGLDYKDYWGDDCKEQFIAYLETLKEPLTVYAHNGGHFDWLFFLKYIGADVTIISGRLVKARIGIHEIRDSYTILPVRLADAGDKHKFDYKKLARSKRNRHRAEILDYLHQDCVVLFDAVTKFQERFGAKLTMAGAAIAKLDAAQEAATGEDARVTLQRLPLKAKPGRPWTDGYFRPFYYGGRVQCFETGIVREQLKGFDSNSAYPYAMANYNHPTGNRFVRQRDIDADTDFAIIDATSHGALPLREESGRLMFPICRATFHATGHEIRAALELGLLDIHRVLEAVTCPLRGNFKPFVVEYYGLRMEAQLVRDETGKLHFKLVLNSSYGRFSLDPDRLYEWQYVPAEIRTLALAELQSHGWQPAFMGPEVLALKRPAPELDKERALRNVATGASITGAARAELLRAIHASERPVYCDTDSLVCRDFGGRMHPTDLGAWKAEFHADRAAIAGKKMYALFGDKSGDAKEDAKRKQLYGTPYCVKAASKGVRLTARQIERVAMGETVHYTADAPSFSLAGVQSKLERDIRMTR